MKVQLTSFKISYPGKHLANLLLMKNQQTKIQPKPLVYCSLRLHFKQKHQSQLNSV